MLIHSSIFHSTDRPAHRIADKIAENFNNALLIVVSTYIVILIYFASIPIDFKYFLLLLGG